MKFFKWQPWGQYPDYRVVATDYDNYSIVYNCLEEDMAYLWVLSRTNTLSQELQDEVFAIIQEQLPNFDLNNEDFDVQNSQCLYVDDDEDNQENGVNTHQFTQ